MEEPQARIHREDPFSTPAELRTPERRFRGRLVAPVTIWTAGGPGSYAGLTVASVLVEESLPSLIWGLVVETADLYDAVLETRSFVVHVLEKQDRTLAEEFAYLRPSPGGPFSALEVEDTEYGPAIARLGTRAFCRLLETSDTGRHKLVQGAIERVETSELDEPLVYFRGRYRRLAP